MNITDLKYVAEIAKTGSMSQAAVNLYMNQPNLSRSIIALEKELGITIFRRSSKGVSLTREGNEFLLSSKEILEKFEAIESKYKKEDQKHYFGISVPRASYISYAFTQFVGEIFNSKNLQMEFLETNSMQVIQNVSSQKHNYGIIRYAVGYEKYFHKLLTELNLDSDSLLEFQYLTIMSKNGPLANKKALKVSDFESLIEIIHGDSTIPSLTTGEIRKPMNLSNNQKNIYIYERGSQFDLLMNVPTTYMWVSPIPPEMLMSYQLILKKVEGSERLFRDVLIHHKAYQMTETDRRFLNCLYQVRDRMQTEII